jgi:acyl carrier protein
MGKTRSNSDAPKSAGGPAIEDIKGTLRQLIEENAGIPADSIRDDSTIDSDLAMDSFSLLSVQVAVEEAFEITFELSDIEERNRFDAIAALVLERVETKPSSAPQPSLPKAKSPAKTSRTKGS